MKLVCTGMIEDLKIKWPTKNPITSKKDKKQFTI